MFCKVPYTETIGYCIKKNENICAGVCSTRYNLINKRQIWVYKNNDWNVITPSNVLYCRLERILLK